MKEFYAKIEIKLKAGVLDPQGKAVLSALHNLGYKHVSDTRIGKLIELKIKEKNNNLAQEKIQKMCKELLANPVIEDYSITVTEV